MEFCKFHPMKAKRFMILVHPVFIISLLLLLVNDHYLKGEYHNGFTGKLSDITGLILLTLLLHILTGRKIWAVLISAAFFTWWKSPLSTPAINLLNEFLNEPLHRKVDYTDLFTLPVVLVVYVVRPMSLNFGKTVKKFGALASGCLCLFAFCRTSAMRPQYNLRDHEVRIDREINSKMSEAEILDKLQSLNITVYKDSIRYYPLRKEELFFHDSSSSDMLPLQWPHNNRDTGLYERRIQNFYRIPEYTVNGERLTDIEFYIFPRREDGSKSMVKVESYQSRRSIMAYDKESQKQESKIKKELKALFRDRQ